MGTGQNLAVQDMAANGEIDIVSYQSEIMEIILAVVWLHRQTGLMIIQIQ